MSIGSINQIEVIPLYSRVGLAEQNLRGLHCGCGTSMQVGCLNVDLLEFKDQTGTATPLGRISKINNEIVYLRHDMTQPFPIEGATFDWAYAEHFVEHISPEMAVHWLREVKRLIKPGGLIRISTPDLRKYVEGYLDPQQSFFAEHHRRLGSIGMSNAPHRKSWMINQIFYFWGHRWLYDFDEIRALAKLAGFSEQSVIQYGFRQGKQPDVFQLDVLHRNDESLYVEICDTPTMSE